MPPCKCILPTTPTSEQPLTRTIDSYDPHAKMKFQASARLQRWPWEAAESAYTLDGTMQLTGRVAFVDSTVPTRPMKMRVNTKHPKYSGGRNPPVLVRPTALYPSSPTASCRKPCSLNPLGKRPTIPNGFPFWEEKLAR